MALLLRESHLRELLAMRDLVPLMERTLSAFSTGGAVQPVRTVVPVEEYGGFLGVMPGYLRARGALGLKAVAFYPPNAARGLPTHMATVLLLDPETGALLAVLDGRLITEMRTAAVSAAATKSLASTQAPVLALLGSGVQARSHVDALFEVSRPQALRVWSRTPLNAVRLAAEVRERFAVHATAEESAQAAVEGADVICTVTGSRTPVLQGAWLRPGAHVNAVGAARPDWRELDTEAVARARVFVDSRAAALVEAGDLVLPLREGTIGQEHILGEIGEVFAGRLAGRREGADITLFKSLGLAVEDVSTAQFAYQQALAAGVGEPLSLE